MAKLTGTEPKLAPDLSIGVAGGTQTARLFQIQRGLLRHGQHWPWFAPFGCRPRRLESYKRRQMSASGKAGNPFLRRGVARRMMARTRFGDKGLSRVQGRRRLSEAGYSWFECWQRLFGGRNHPAEAITSGNVGLGVGRRFGLGCTAADLRRGCPDRRRPCSRQRRMAQERAPAAPSRWW